MIIIYKGLVPNDVFTTLLPLNPVYEAVSPSVCKQLNQPCNTDWCRARFPIRKTTDLQQFVFSRTVGRSSNCKAQYYQLLHEDAHVQNIFHVDLAVTY